MTDIINTNRAKAVKVTLLAICRNDKLTVLIRDWTEIYAPSLKLSEEVKEWAWETSGGISVGKVGQWVTADYADLVDRFTCDFADGQEDDSPTWSEAQEKLSAAVHATLASGEGKIITIGGKSDFGTFKLTPCGRLPSALFEDKFQPPPSIRTQIEDAICTFNVDSLPARTWSVTVRAICSTVMTITASSKAEAEEMAFNQVESADLTKFSEYECEAVLDD